MLDPFSGTATAGAVALQHGRGFVGIELNPEYQANAAARLEIALVPPTEKPKPARKTRVAQRSLFGDGATA